MGDGYASKINVSARARGRKQRDGRYELLCSRVVHLQVEKRDYIKKKNDCK